MRRALVLGGAGVIGAAVCRALARSGTRLALTYHLHTERARALAAELGAEALPLDLAHTAGIAPVIDRAAEALGGLDALVNCAGIPSPANNDERANLDAIDEASWDTLMAVNLRGVFFAARAAARHLHEGDNIVLVGSVDGVKALPGPIDHATARAALGGLVRSLAKALGPRGICVNAVAPGLLSEGVGRLLSPEVQAEYDKHVALKRRGRAEEVAELVARLVRTNSYLDGQTIAVDGGL